MNSKKINRIKKMGRHILSILIMGSMIVTSGCSVNTSQDSKEGNGKLNVVATIFPQYDFLREIGGDYINLKMLLPPGAESHSFEPTPKDIKTMENADFFVEVGGESDAWVDQMLKSVNQKDMTILSLMDCVTCVEEEVIEGMEEEDSQATSSNEEDTDTESSTKKEKAGDGFLEKNQEIEYDEHVWTSPVNAIAIVKQLRDKLCKLDPAHKKNYTQNAKVYIEKLSKLDQDIRKVVENGKRKEIIVGDRFPFRYLVREYGLHYYAAFPGCSLETEPDASTIAFLINKVKKDKIPVVFHIELSNEKMTDSICSETGASSEQLNAVHNIGLKDFKAGVTYLDLMNENVLVLKKALN